MSRDAYQLQGQNGGEVIGDTTAHDGNWSIIQVIEDAVIADIVSSLSGAASLVGGTISAGILIGGATTSITLDSGIVIAYN